MLKNVVFDMGNVLARFDARAFCAGRVRDEADRKMVYDAVFASVPWAQIDRGVVSNADAVRAMCALLPERLHADAAWLVGHWYDHFAPDPAMEAFIGGLKRSGRFGIYLLSNAGTDFYSFAPRLGALRFFDGLLVSCDVHFLKPDKRIFDALCAKFSLRPEECFFVDDMFSNVEAALNLGFSGMVYRGDIGELSAALESAA